MTDTGRSPSGWPTPGIHHGVSFADYLDTPAISSSHLRRILTSPRDAHLHESGSSAAMDLGSAFHAYSMDHETDRIVVADTGRRTKTFAELQEANPDKVVITADQHEAARRMVREMDDQGYLPLVRGHECEVSYLWNADGDTSKARADILDREAMIVRDIKTTSTALDDHTLVGVVQRFGYHVQAEHYLAGLELLTGRTWTFEIVWVQSSGTYGCRRTPLDGGWREAAKIEYREALQRHRVCTAANHWPGYSPNSTQFGCPAWVIEAAERHTREDFTDVGF